MALGTLCGHLACRGILCGSSPLFDNCGYCARIELDSIWTNPLFELPETAKMSFEPKLLWDEEIERLQRVE